MLPDEPWQLIDGFVRTRDDRLTPRRIQFEGTQVKVKPIHRNFGFLPKVVSPVECIPVACGKVPQQLVTPAQTKTPVCQSKPWRRLVGLAGFEPTTFSPPVLIRGAVRLVMAGIFAFWLQCSVATGGVFRGWWVSFNQQHRTKI